jgi:hypothetical protein
MHLLHCHLFVQYPEKKTPLLLPLKKVKEEPEPAR